MARHVLLRARARASSNHYSLVRPNLCAEKWMNPDFSLNYLADELIGTLAQCGIQIVNVGNTYLADRLTNEGNIIESALDHSYLSCDLIFLFRFEQSSYLFSLKNYHP